MVDFPRSQVSISECRITCGLMELGNSHELFLILLNPFARLTIANIDAFGACQPPFVTESRLALIFDAMVAHIDQL